MTRERSDDPRHNAGTAPKAFDAEPGVQVLRGWIEEADRDLQAAKENRRLERYPELDRNGNPQDKRSAMAKLDQSIVQLSKKKAGLELDLQEHQAYHEGENQA